MIKVSVIIPVYNVSKYVERCARSLFEQTMREIEYIFVDDFSPDDSIDIIKNVLKDYPERSDSVFFCSHQENKGLPTTRNTGFQKATGDFIAHCDSDDWVSPELYSILYETAIRDGADIVCCDFYKSDGETTRVIPVNDYNGGLLQGPVWNKIAKRSLYDNIVFPKTNKAEDGAIMTQLSFFAKKITVVHTPLYFYFDNPKSICLLPSKQACINRFKQECENTELRITFLIKQKAQDKYKLDILMMKYYTLTNLIPFLKDNDVYQLWKHQYPEIRKLMFSGNQIPLRVRISYFLMYCKQVGLLQMLRR